CLPDKNRNQTTWSTEKFQKLIRAKNILLDKYEKEKYDEELIKQGVRNPNAKPLLCDICSNVTHSFQKRCLQGHGHKSPHWHELKKAEKEFEKVKTEDFLVRFEKKFDECLKLFINEKLHKLVPFILQKDHNDPGDIEFIQITGILESEVSNYLEAFLSENINSISKIITSVFYGIGSFNSDYCDDKKLKKQAHVLLSKTLIKSSIFDKLLCKQHVNDKDNLFDTSVLNLNELKILCDFFCIKFSKGASIDDLENEVKLVLKFESKNARMPNSSKLPYLDMEIRCICIDCKKWFNEFQAVNFFNRAVKSISSNSITVSTFIAICDLSKLINHERSFCLQIDTFLAKEMLKIKEYNRLFAYLFCKTCKGIEKMDIFKEVEFLGTTIKSELMKKYDIEFEIHVNMLNEEIHNAINKNSFQDLLDLLLIYEQDNRFSGNLHCNYTFSKDSLKGMKLLGEAYWKGCTTYFDEEEDIKFTEFFSHLATQSIVSNARMNFFKNLEHISSKNFLTCLNIDETDILNSPCLHSTMNIDHLSTPIANIKMFKKFEASINTLFTGKKWESIDVAFAYYDFITSCSTPSQFLITTLVAAQWFAKAMSNTYMIESKKYACKDMVLKLTSLAASLAFELGTHAYLQFYAAHKICALQFYAIKNVAYGLEPEEEAKSLCENLEWLVCSSRVCPILSLPSFINSSEALFFNFFSREAHCEYLFAVMHQEETKRQLTDAILRYKIFENHFNGICEVTEEFEDETKLNAMSALLNEKGYDWEGVQQLTNSNLLRVDKQGWLKINQSLLGPIKKDGICRVKGFSINKKSNDIDLILGKSFLTSILLRNQPLLCWQDIATSILMSSPVCVFSLDGINQRETNYHPFNQYFFMPEELDGTEFLSTLFHTDYLLKQFSMGEEISLVPPFKHRSVYNGLLKDLPHEIQEVLKPIHLRGFSKSRVHRLWIQADEMDLDIKEDNENVLYLFGDINMSVRCMPMFYNDCGELQDQNEVDPNSPESQFASDFTKNYEKIGKFFPEFLRLRELCKIQRLGQLLDLIKDSKLKEIENLVDPNNEELNMRLKSNLRQAILDQKSHLESVFSKIYCEVRKQVVWINDDVIEQVRSSINSQFGILISYSDISNWLKHSNSETIIKEIMLVKSAEIDQRQKKSFNDLINEKKNQLKAFQDKIEELKKISKEKLLPLKPKNGCKWVPAVCHSKDERIRYGGVSLCPKIKYTNLTVNYWTTSATQINAPVISKIHTSIFVPKVFQPLMSLPQKKSSSAIGSNLNEVKNKKCGGKNSGGGENAGGEGSSGGGGNTGDEGNARDGKKHKNFSYLPQDVLPNYGIVKIKRLLNSLGLDHKRHRFVGNTRNYILQYEKTDTNINEVLKKLEDLFQLKPQPKDSKTGGKIWIFPLNYGLTKESGKTQVPSVSFTLRERSGEGRPTLDVTINNSKYTKDHAPDDVRDKINDRHIIKVRIGLKNEIKTK
ncbi:uncharacterized protein LOC136079363, partial [Hydra vulgaris]|uniref:Uncharacterized protein LOC136079363 n=1 Tax=Hydra vulgaris TaxID=6087 RepID=A0ABM4BPU9_HYDVU